jgi:formate dehydrogenase maturation protein FdhE
MNCTGCQNGKLRQSIYNKSGNHIKETCKFCKRFIKFVKQEQEKQTI